MKEFVTITVQEVQSNIACFKGRVRIEAAITSFWFQGQSCFNGIQGLGSIVLSNISLKNICKDLYFLSKLGFQR